MEDIYEKLYPDIVSEFQSRIVLNELKNIPVRKAAIIKPDCRDVPIAVQQTRLIEEMDRKTIRACYSVMAMSEAEFSKP